MKHLILSRLEFKCTNNISEYEALMVGLQKAISLNMVVLKVVVDSEIVVRQVRNTIHYLSPHLKSYQQEVWWLISIFQAFNITVVPRTYNAAANALENVASMMSPIRDIFTIEILYRPSIPDNINNIRMFGDDQQILPFMSNADTFKDAVIDEDKHEWPLQEEASSKKGHLIPKGVASLEKIHDLQECFQWPRNIKTHNSTMMHEIINLGTKQDPKFVNISTCCT